MEPYQIDLSLKKYEKQHAMKTRNFETHKVEFSNTGRYGKSNIPYMQGLLGQTREL